MKKRFKQADGTEVEIEGTAEELAEYERKIREGTKPVSIGKKKPVLHGAEVDGIPMTESEMMLVRMQRVGLLPQKEYSPPVFIPPYHLQDYQLPPCWVCGQYNCHVNHIWCTTTTTGNVKLGETVYHDGTKVTLTTDNTKSLFQTTVNTALEAFDRINKTPSS